MRVFVSWSGELSKQIAEALKKWIPCIIQSVEVFYSAEDIEKGESWDSKISAELSKCNYGIICLTEENKMAPWIHFEAGALTKSLDSRATTLLININPSDIKGPLARYQSTFLDKKNFEQLIHEINKNCDPVIPKETLNITFNAMWDSLKKDIDLALSSQKVTSRSAIKKEEMPNAPLEEILQLLRRQNSLLSSPENLFPSDFYERMSEILIKYQMLAMINTRDIELVEKFDEYLKLGKKNLTKEDSPKYLEALRFLRNVDDTLCLTPEKGDKYKLVINKKNDIIDNETKHKYNTKTEFDADKI